MRILALPLVVIAFGCRSDKLIKAADIKCGQPCYAGYSSNAGVGICKEGTWQCDSVDSEPICVGWVAPAEEQCNGQDNNCDGKMDTDVRWCSSVCGMGVQVCTLGFWDSCSARTPKPEICNGVDDDCDGVIDNVDYSSNPYCYTGSPSTVGKGICHPGFKSCNVEGYEECLNEQLPKAEVCNGLDDNCDGIVDEGVNRKPKDIIVCIDESGSMGDKIMKVQTTTKSWANKFAQRVDLKFALESCPGHDPSEDSIVILRQNLTDAVTFNTAVGGLFAGNTGSEPTIDAVAITADHSNPLGLNWTTGAERIMIQFTDEEAQSYATPGYSAGTAGAMAADAGIKLFEFIDFTYSSTFDPMVIPTGGAEFDIYGTYAEIEANLDSIVNECN